MAKVKKRAVVTGVRNVKASKKKAPARTKPASQGKASKTRSKARTMSRGKALPKAAAKAGKASLKVAAPVVRFVVKPLEPQAKCGAGTSVQYLFKVDQTVDGKKSAHLVFFDRHGWYCEHGRNCPAVEHAKKYRGHIARAS